MIAFLTGKLVEAEPTQAIIDVNGVGYTVRIPLSTFEKIKGLDKVHIHTHLHITEDAHTLFGFSSPLERSMFQLLISISGVGPSIALMALSSYTPKELKMAIAAENVKQIQSIKGIGGKTAQRIILELKDKIHKEGIESDGNTPELSATINNTLKTEALSALITLGFNKAVAEKTIDRILKEHGPDSSLEDLIKLALRST